MLVVNLYMTNYIVQPSVCLSVITCTVQSRFLAHLSRRLKGELIVYRSIRHPSVSASVCA